MRKVIKPVSVKEQLDCIFKYLNENGHNLPQDHHFLQMQENVKFVKENFVDAGSLVKISSFAGIYGKKFFGKQKVSTQAIYQAIQAGKVAEINIDEVKFVDRNILIDEQED